MGGGGGRENVPANGSWEVGVGERMSQQMGHGRRGWVSCDISIPVAPVTRHWYLCAVDMNYITVNIVLCLQNSFET